MRDFLESYGNFILRAFDFNGRATPVEYWAVFPVIWGLILYAAVLDVTTILNMLAAQRTIPLNPLAYNSFIFFVVTIIPRMSLNLRRLHDANRSAI